jgi:hypothetical protein
LSAPSAMQVRDRRVAAMRRSCSSRPRLRVSARPQDRAGARKFA